MTIFHNLFRTFRRFRTPVLINILGLTAAFSAFIIIMMQVTFEKNYESKTPNSDRIYRVALHVNESKVWAIWPKPLINECIASSPHVIEGSSLCTYEKNSFCTIRRSDGSEVISREDFARVDPSMVSILGLKIIAGDRNVLSHPDVYLISEKKALNLFGTTNVVGKTINNKPIGAVYVDRPANSVIESSIFYAPKVKDEPLFSHDYIFIVKLDDPKNVGEVIQSFNATIARYYKGTWLDNGNSGFPTATVTLTSLSDLYFSQDADYDLPAKGSRTTVNIALSIALLIIVIAIINYINFASSLTPLRIKSINLEKILGANVHCQRILLLFESVVISIAAFVLALFVVQFLSLTALPRYFDIDFVITSNWIIVIKLSFVALGVGAVAGLYPAFYMTSFPPILALKGSFGMSQKGRFYRSMLICFQFVISLILIIVTLFVNLQNLFVSKFDVGFNKKNIACVDIPKSIAKQQNLLTSQIKAFGDLEDVAFSKEKFGASDTYMFNSADFGGQQNNYNCIVVSTNFLDMFGIEVVEGRSFMEQDKSKPYGTLVFNHEAKVLDPIKIKVGAMFGHYQDGWAGTGEIVGIAAPNLHTLSLRQNEVPTCFFTANKMDNYLMTNVYIKIKQGASIPDAIAHIKQAFRNIDSAYSPDISLFDNASNTLYQKEQRSGFIITAFSVLAILISLMGVFGLVLFETQYRKKEIGVRRVFGASVAGILQMINIKFIKIVLICFAISVPVSFWIVKRWLEAYACKTPIYWWVFALALLIVLLITILTVTLRSYTVATSNPSAMVRTE